MSDEKLNEIVVERNLIIPLSDGAELGADLYRPAGEGKFPALLSFYPYHKDDFIGAMNEAPRRYFAARGYAHLLIDFRGLGGSSGVAWDAMERGEGRDGAEAVEWIARQPWCDGNVGMWGLSYGGISSLKVGAENPPHLKAIAPLQGSVDIYHDILVPGGCRNMLGAYGAWGSMMLAMNLMPPTNADADGRWYKVWRERLEASTPYIFNWDAHPYHDEYWDAKVVDPARIKVPTFLIGGWRDIFPDGMPAIYPRLGGPKKLLMGPWMHTLPDLAPSEPIDYLPELKRWFDHWLRGEKNGIESEPPVTIFVQQGDKWRHEREWPLARAKSRTLHLAHGGKLADSADREEGSESYVANPTVGTSAGLWDPIGLGVGMPTDQNDDEHLSLVYTSEPLGADAEITGAGQATIHAELKEGDEATLVAKLCDVDPDGGSTLITSGWLRATCRETYARRAKLERGEVYEFKIPLWATSYRVAHGHRIRLVIACADFPRIWPTKSNPEIRLFFGGKRGSTLSLPIVERGGAADGPRVRSIPPAALPNPRTPIWKIERDMVSGAVTVTTGQNVAVPLPQGGVLHVDHAASARVSANRPDEAVVRGDTSFSANLPVIGNFAVKTQSWVTQHGMLLSGRVTIDDRVVFDKRWEK
ncbi:MAG TPA: CocE/NonD family hydrolase [Candidatus Binataceae bacterium]|nr:CocE/NonD family hydrolase [Candidatus Binataceae bacterium]